MDKPKSQTGPENQPNVNAPSEKKVLNVALSFEQGSLRGTLDEVKKIATGGMSHIFQARQPSLDRYIVVKKLKEELFNNPETIERFRREAKALAAVLHQNVAHVYDFVESGRESYLLMEFIEGMDLSVIIQKVGHLPPDVAAALLLNVARGVNYIHGYHLIHRDIKPANIRITPRGEVKLMDFGIVMDIENTSLTRPGMMVGSPSYLSPEQVLGDSITPKADIFLLGITLYESLTGTRPFKDEGKETVFQRIRETKYVPARQMNSAIPKALDRIIQKALEKDPEDRFGSVNEMVSALEHFLGPSKSNHTSDVILKYLDQEALLTPAMDYQEINDNRGFWAKIPWAKLGLLLIGLGLGFAAGYYFRQRSPVVLETTAPPPKAIKPIRK